MALRGRKEQIARDAITVFSRVIAFLTPGIEADTVSADTGQKAGTSSHGAHVIMSGPFGHFPGPIGKLARALVADAIEREYEARGKEGVANIAQFIPNTKPFARHRLTAQAIGGATSARRESAAVRALTKIGLVDRDRLEQGKALNRLGRAIVQIPFPSKSPLRRPPFNIPGIPFL